MLNDTFADVKRVEAFRLLGSVPDPSSPLSEPVTVNVVGPVNAIVSVSLAVIPGQLEARDRRTRRVRARRGPRACPAPSEPLTEPVTVYAVAEVNSTVSVSATAVRQERLLIEPLFVELVVWSRPPKSYGLRSPDRSATSTA